MIKNIREAAMDMLRKVSIDGNHKYTRTTDGKMLAGVTEVASYGGFKEARGWMPAWGGKEAVMRLGYFERFIGENHEAELNELAEKLELIKGLDDESFLELLHHAKSAHSDKSRKARDIGSEAHEWLEKYLKETMREKPAPELPKMGEWIEGGIKEFIALTKDWKFVLAEARVARPNEPYEYAGTLDALALIKDEPAIVDFKFADNVSKSWVLQTAAYARTFRDYGININKRVVFRFPKSAWLKRWVPAERAYRKIPNKFEVIEYPAENLDFDFETFMSFRRADKWVNSKNNGKI